MAVKEEEITQQLEEEVHIAGIIVYCDPAKMQSVLTNIALLPKAECHAQSPEGKLVITLETSNVRRTVDYMDAIRALPGVYEVSLVYQHAESAAAMEEEVQS